MRAGYLVILGAAATLGLGTSLSAQTASVPQTKRPMKIGIIGAGQIGGTLVRRLRELGHDVTVSNSRSPGGWVSQIQITADPCARALARRRRIGS